MELWKTRLAFHSAKSIVDLAGLPIALNLPLLQKQIELGKISFDQAIHLVMNSAKEKQSIEDSNQRKLALKAVPRPNLRVVG